MGIRLNISANPPVRTGLEPSEPVAAPTGGGAPNPRPPAGAGVAEPIQRPAAAPAAPRPEPSRAAEPIQRPAAAPAAPRSNPADQQPFSVESAQSQAQPQVGQVQTAEIRPADSEANAAQQQNLAPAARLRNFRFFSAAESIRERDLEVRLNRLENELESAGRRIQSTDAFSIRNDAELDRARLRTDLEMVQRQITRLRLQQVFGGPAAHLGGTQVSAPIQQAAPVEAQPASEEAHLNLLA